MPDPRDAHPHPLQPVDFDADGEVVRFKENKIVSWMLDQGREGQRFDLHMIGLEVARDRLPEADLVQLSQLIGYSVSGFGELSYAPTAMVEECDRIVDWLVAARSGAAPADNPASAVEPAECGGGAKLSARSFRFEAYKARPVEQWERPGKAEWRDHVQVIVPRAQITRVMRELLAALDAGEDADLMILGELEQVEHE